MGRASILAFICLINSRYSATTPRAKVLKEVRNVAVMISMEKGAMARGSGHHQHGGHRHDG